MIIPFQFTVSTLAIAVRQCFVLLLKVTSAEEADYNVYGEFRNGGQQE